MVRKISIGGSILFVMLPALAGNCILNILNTKNNQKNFFNLIKSQPLTDLVRSNTFAKIWNIKNTFLSALAVFFTRNNVQSVFACSYLNVYVFLRTKTYGAYIVSAARPSRTARGF